MRKLRPKVRGQRGLHHGGRNLSCQAGQSRVGKRAARKNGITPASSRGGATSGSARNAVAGAKKKRSGAKKKADKDLPNQRQVNLAAEFTPEELQRLSIELRLGAAAVDRQLGYLNSGARVGRGDSRPLDWARLDRQQYRFLVPAVSRARKEKGLLDTSGLKKEELKELWAFLRFEADRAHRNIDHLVTKSGGSDAPGGPTAAYLAANHKLNARFCTYLAGEIGKILAAAKVKPDELADSLRPRPDKRRKQG